MAGSVKVDHYEALVTHVAGQSIAGADFRSTPIDMRPAGHYIVTVKWSGYNGTTGKAYVQLTDGEPNAVSPQWQNWGSERTQRTLNTASGIQVFNIWQAPVTPIRVAVDRGDGTAGTIDITYRLKRG